MAKSNPLEFYKNLDTNNLKPLYLLHGEEQYFIDLIADKIQKNAIPEHEKGFNEVVLYGKDVTIGDILNNARRFPMMADKQLVLVREIQEIQDLNNKEQEALLESYISNPLNSTILVLVSSKSIDERKAWVKAIKKHGEVFKSVRPYDNELPAFINQLLSIKDLKITPKASQLLVEHLGNNLKNIANEIEKIVPNLKDKNTIDEQFIEQFVGISKDYNVFELQKAIGTKNVVKAYEIVKYFADNQKDHPIQPIIIVLFNYFCKLILAHSTPDKSDKNLAEVLNVNPYFLRDYTSAMRNYPMNNLVKIIESIRIADQKSKGIGTGSESVLMIYNELIYSILN